MRVTTLGRPAPGSRVNLERPIRADGRLGGHFVRATWTASAASKTGGAEADSTG